MPKLSADQKARIFRLPVVNLYEKKLSHDGLVLIPEKTAYKERFIIFEVGKDYLKVALENPQNNSVYEILEGIKKSAGRRVELFVASPESISYALEWYKDRDLTDKAEEKSEKETEERAEEAEKKINIKTPEGPKFNFPEDIFDHAIRLGANKIHIECTDKKATVYYHIKKLHAISETPKELGEQFISEIKNMAHIEESHTHKQGDFAISDKDKFYRFIVTSFPLPIGEKINIEIEEIDEDRFSLSYLGMREEQIKYLDKELQKDNGIFFVTGPDGSGRTSTMYALVKKLLKRGKKIVTLENPIDCYLKGVDQVQVNPLEGLTYMAGFKKVLLQPYDVIMIEGVRDSQTLRLVFEAVKKGKIIIAPLYDKDIFKVFGHLEEMGIEDKEIVKSVNAIINQRLVLRLCSNCKQEVSGDNPLEDTIKREMDKLLKTTNHSNIKLREFGAHKCKSCDMTGFFGHTALFEVVVVDDKTEKLLRVQKGNTREDNALSQNGIITLYQDGLIKAFEGTTTLDEVKRVIE